MSNGDEFVTILPEFEIYRTHLSHGREPMQVKTDVLGVKCAPCDAKLLTEFFARMGTETSSDRDGVFLPKGAVHLLGPTTYEQVLKDNNFFLTTVATIPINLEYRAWFAVINPTTSSESEPTSLHDHLLRKTWFLRIEEVDRRKCIILTTKTNLPEARAWIDTNLEPLIRKSIPEGIDPPSSQLPRRLDKPVYSASSKTYADVLKQRFSLAPSATTSATDNIRPPRKRQAAIIDYDSDGSSAVTEATTAGYTNDTTQNNSKSTIVNAAGSAQATDLASIKKELNELRTMITDAVEQFKTAMAALATKTTSKPKESNEMDTEDNPSSHSNAKNQHTTDLSDVIQDLKYELATIITETRAVFEQQLFRASTINSHPQSVT